MPSKVPSESHFLGKILKAIHHISKVLAKSVNRYMRKCLADGTYDSIKYKPKFKRRAPLVDKIQNRTDFISCLLVEDVDGHDAEGVVVLDGARGSVLAEAALGHLWEDSVHGILPGVQVHFTLCEHITSELGELVAKEHVCQVDLTDHVDEVENLAE